jgi:hypothetical protein
MFNPRKKIAWQGNKVKSNTKRFAKEKGPGQGNKLKSDTNRPAEEKIFGKEINLNRIRIALLRKKSLTRK